MSFPEAEETRLLSNNLLKRGFTSWKEEDTRIIDSNALVAKKIGKTGVNRITPMPEDKDGFARGLSADVLEVLPKEEEADAVLEAASAEDGELLGPSAEELREQALFEIEKMKEEAAAVLESEKRKALEEARKQGYTDGYEQGMQEAEKLKKQLSEEKSSLERQYEEQLDSLEPRFIDTMTGIYEHIFNVELSGYRDIIVHLIANTLRKTEGGKSYIVHVSKEDYPYVSMQKKQIAATSASGNSSLEIIEDITLSQNQALIETDGGIFDCSLGTQLSELSKKLTLLSYEKSGEEKSADSNS